MHTSQLETTAERRRTSLAPERSCVTRSPKDFSVSQEQSAPPRSTFGARLSRHLVSRVLKAVGDPAIAVELWNGEMVSACDPPPPLRVVIHEPWTLLRLLADAELRFGEEYSAGRLSVRGDLVDFLAELNRGLDRRARTSRRRSPLHRLLGGGSCSTRARRDIEYHYDLGNDFYRLWLDERLLYTCAYFPRRDMTLEEAQIAKIDHVCRKLELRPGQTVIEAGCGWGATALHMARRYGVTVKAYNISTEQLHFARRRAVEEGLQDRVEFVAGDWRDIQGSCDAFVSIGMLEHVGVNHYRRLGEVIDGCLKPDGRGLLHFIGRNEPRPLDRWTKRYIFPGAHVPAWLELGPIFEPYRFSILDIENLRPHYALTMRHWRTRFESARNEVVEMFDERFTRMWHLYLAGSEAAFQTGWLQLFQITFARAASNAVPWTRDHLCSTGS